MERTSLRQKASISGKHVVRLGTPECRFGTFEAHYGVELPDNEKSRTFAERECRLSISIICETAIGNAFYSAAEVCEFADAALAEVYDGASSGTVRHPDGRTISWKGIVLYHENLVAFLCRLAANLDAIYADKFFDEVKALENDSEDEGEAIQPCAQAS